MSDLVKVTEMPASEFPAYLDGMNKMMREWANRIGNRPLNGRTTWRWTPAATGGGTSTSQVEQTAFGSLGSAKLR